jgi:hypothetical protein
MRRSGINCPRLVFLLLPAAIPALITLAMIAWYGVNVPQADSWATAYDFAYLSDFKDLVSRLFSSHNEHRVVVPRVVTLLLATLSGWNVKLEMYVGFLVAAAGFGAILATAWRNRAFGASAAPFAMSALAGSFAYFSWMQHENWLWGFQIAFFLTQTMFLAGLHVLHRDDWNPCLRVVAGGLFALLSTLSMAHGMFAWVALLPSLLAIPATRRARTVFLTAWVVTAALVAAAYFGHGVNYYKEPGAHAPGLGTTLKLTVGLLGSQFGETIHGKPFKSALWSGAAVLLLLAAGIIQARRSGAEWRRIAPWISLALFAGAFCFAVAHSRGIWGISVTMVSRYTTGPPLALIAGLELWRLACERTFARGLGRAFACICLTTIAGVTINSFRVLDEISADSRNLRFASKLLPVVDQFSDTVATPVGDPFLDVVSPLPHATAIQGMKIMNARGIRKLAPPLGFPPAGACDTGVFDLLGTVQPHGGQPEGGAGKWQPLRTHADESIQLKGQAIIQPAQGKPDAILFVRDGETVLRTAAPPMFLPGDPSRAAWDHLVTASAFGSGSCTITAYAYWAGIGTLERICTATNRLEILEQKHGENSKPDSP